MTALYATPNWNQLNSTTHGGHMKRDISLAISAVLITAMCATYLYSGSTNDNAKDWATIIALLTFLWAGMIRTKRVVLYCYVGMLCCWALAAPHWGWSYPIVLILANFVAVILAAVDCVIAERLVRVA
jgi:hypothetical protein